ncbi:ABC transporter permease [Micromonospora sp. NBC_01796]|uniref:ABC transporter permease n=1 Tax=Micromonospora sp. NBC_01796 TaxID=2975987 RepID=UPI002DDA58F0|nr:ABC transporter permease [Micromonospora sp. NBC_01796]WSA86896.1 ABC transporter permease [Micromonospora sp. NBC_01796]
MNRVLPATRVHLITWPTLVAWPWGILLTSFVFNLVLFTGIGDDIEGGPQTGGLVSVYIVTMVSAGQSITQFFPFSLGLSVTRRTFYAAVSLLLLGESLLFGVMLYLCKLAERATDGWGISMGFFAPSFLNSDNPVLQILIYMVPFLVLGFFGIFAALVMKRWGITGLYVLSIGLLSLLGLPAVLITWQGWWLTIGRWFGDQSALTLFAGWPALLALALAGAGLLTIRRATT